MDYNKVLTAGRLTRDPELRYTPQGAAVCEFAIAVNRRWTNKQTGEKMEEVSFFDCVTWARTAETVAQYLHKGSEVFLDGRLQQDRWQDAQSGQNRSKVKIIAELVRFLDKRENTGAPPAEQPAGQEGAW